MDHHFNPPSIPLKPPLFVMGNITTATDPTEAWIEFILQHGAFNLLLGIPALAAWFAINYRSKQLEKLRPHSYGRTALIFWPSQIFIFLACLSLVGLLVALGWETTNGMWSGAFLMLFSWHQALYLNRNEHRYKTRSSDTLFLWYIITIILNLIAIYILHDQASALPKLLVPTIIQYLALFAGFITLGFVVEAWPRSNTKVQALARETENLSEYDLANLCSRLTYHYVDRIVSLSAKRPLVPADIDHTTPDYLRTNASYSRVSQAWEDEAAKAKATNGKYTPSFFWTVIRAYKARVLVSLFLRCVAFRLPFLTPILFKQLLAFITDYHRATNSGQEDVPALRGGLVIAFALFAINMVGTVLGTMALQWSYDFGMLARGASIAMVYRKALKLSPAARQKSTLGEITNHMAVDAEKWIIGSSFMPAIFFVPVDIAISMYLLYQLFGWSSVAGLVVVAVVVPLNAKMASFLNTFQDEKLKWMDTRIRALTEILSSIKIVKLYGWEDAFREKIEALRSKELLAHKRFVTIRAVLAIVFSSVTLLMALATFSLYATIGGPGGTPGKMTAEVIFVGITLFGILNRPLGRVTMMISQTIAVTVACRRIQNFLLLEEIDTTIVHRSDRQGPSEDSSPAIAVSIQKGTFTWEKPVEITSLTETNDENSPLLDIELNINDGSLTAIVGRIGQGKSSLLSALMGDMYKVDGVVRVFGDIAYVPQQAWIINATLKDNILFGQPFDQEKYDRIVFASGLVPDFVMLPAGDQTEIGERGINLSGGQKQRVSLARAAYQDADVYLLDDPLSAVDAHVDQHLWNHLIGPKGLLKTKTRLLVTHGVHHLEHVDQIVVFKDGSVSETGQYQELMEAGGSFYQLIKEYSVNVSTRQADQEEEFITDVDPGSGSSSSGASIIPEGNEDKKVEKEGKGNSGAGELVAVEKMQNGRVSWSVVQTYSRAASYFNAVNCLLLFILGQAAHIGTNLWLRYWITDTDTSKENHEGRPVAFYLLGYAFFVLLFMVLDVSANYSAEVICGIRASRVLFQRLLVRVLQMPMSFFDTTPLGRIINRLSSDIDAIDTQLPNEMNDLLRFLAMIAGTFFVIAYSTPAFLIMIPPLGFVYFLIQDHYIRCSASMKRLYSVSKSPLYQHFSESLSGVSTIRVVRGLQDQFVAQNASRADTIVNRLNIYALSNRWLSTRIEFLGNVTILLASVLAVLNARTLDPTLSALALTYAINIVGQLTYLVRTVNEVQNLLVSVERVDEYSVKPIEAPRVTGVALPERWPEQGRVVFKNYSARYRVGLDLVIRNASFEVLPGEKVGIVGRTGAGKSSLALALFRIVEAADSYWALASDPLMEGKKVDFDDIQLGNAGGSIEIDGVDISTLGLRDLRQHLAIIPQDPTLFAGTVRENLDPFSEVSDADLWEALERAHLKSYISSLAGGLSYEVAQNGDNFSVGQRSLICLARALLRKTKVLILDEATAAVDVETDDLIQKTIRKEFKDRTILTIAHRVKTVMDSDKILVLEKGCVNEYDSPKELLKTKSSLFYRLAQKAGEV
ncbi:hypothetical protein MVEG_06599 [Podila verticillata NRRL 6337]|nr:hypothetical protein MVEG_06599 [Podila verticillata NRRL 6337]